MRRVAETKGMMTGHLLRRAIHISTFIIPLIYYFWGNKLAAFFGLRPPHLVIIVVVLILLLEALRLKFGWTIVGQRDYEKKTISAFTWGSLSIGLVLLFAPGAKYGIPIIWSCAFGDPVVGELRHFGVRPIYCYLIGFLCIFLIWMMCNPWLNTPMWWAPIMGIITTAVEWPNIKWLDDNALMQLVPLIIVLLATNFM